MRFCIAPEASVPTVAIEHGQITYASTFAEPLAYGLEVVLAVDRDLLRGVADEPLEHLLAWERRIAVQLGREHLDARARGDEADLAVDCRERAHETLGVGAPDAPVTPRKTRTRQAYPARQSMAGGAKRTSSVSARRIRASGVRLAAYCHALAARNAPSASRFSCPRYEYEPITVFPNCAGFERYWTK